MKKSTRMLLMGPIASKVVDVVQERRAREAEDAAEEEPQAPSLSTEMVAVDRTGENALVVPVDKELERLTRLIEESGLDPEFLPFSDQATLGFGVLRATATWMGLQGSWFVDDAGLYVLPTRRPKLKIPKRGDRVALVLRWVDATAILVDGREASKSTTSTRGTERKPFHVTKSKIKETSTTTVAARATVLIERADEHDLSITMAASPARLRGLLAESSAQIRRRTVTPTAQTSTDIPDQIRRLSELRDAGVLTEDEFATKKAELLGRL
jgi:hypothetical protein